MPCWPLLRNNRTLCTNRSMHCGFLLQGFLDESNTFSYSVGWRMSRRLLLSCRIWIPNSVSTRLRLSKCFNERRYCLHGRLLLHCSGNVHYSNPFATGWCQMPSRLLLSNWNKFANSVCSGHLPALHHEDSRERLHRLSSWLLLRRLRFSFSFPMRRWMVL